MQPPLIIGGGPAGAAAAIRLAQAGLPPTLLERTAGPHDNVCGDFLSGEAAAGIEALGVDLAALGPAAIRQIRLVRGGRMAIARLPFPAFGLSRRRLDEALLRQAEAVGARIRRGETVRRLEMDGNGFRLHTDGGDWRAPAVFLATGKHDLRGVPRPRNRRMVGLKTYFRLNPDQRAALEGAVEVILLPGGYAGLQPVEDGAAVFCALFRGPLSLSEIIARSPHLRGRLADAEPLRDRPVTIAGMPYGFLATAETHPGLVRLGDQAGVIPSLAGAGVAVALATGQRAASAFLQCEARPQRRISASLVRPVRLAWLMHQSLLNSGTQPVSFRLCSTFPPLMRLAAHLTRIPSAA